MARHRWDDDPNRPKSRWERIESPDDQMKRLLEKARSEESSEDSLLLGRSLRDGHAIRITPKTLSTHMHVVGATGVGKSFFLEGIIKNLILSGQGVCLIDPHGTLYQRVLDFCAHANHVRPDLKLAKRVIPINIAERDHILGFNPVQRNARVKIYQVVALMEAVRKCWGQGSFQETPRLARWLFNTLYAVIDSETTFLQTYPMVTPQVNPYRQAITRQIKNPQIRGEWDWLADQTDQRREERLESCLMRSRPGAVRRCATPSSFSSRSCLSRMIVSVTVDPAERIWRLNSCGEMRLAVHWRPERTCDG